MKIKNMKIYNTIQNSGTIMHFLDQNLKIKNGEQLKHRNIINEILWITVYMSYNVLYWCAPSRVHEAHRSSSYCQT